MLSKTIQERKTTAAAAATADGSTSASIVAALYSRTKALHVEAERTGIIRDLLRGNASRDGYALLMRNLLPAYRALEHGLERHRSSSGLGHLAKFRFDRASTIESDLMALRGEHWSREIPVLPAAGLYANRISEAAEGDGLRLVAHAYTRYLGDLSGGQVLQRLLARSLQLQPNELSFYDFPRFSDLNALKTDYREALKRAGKIALDPDAIIEEGALAFSHNIALSCAVQAMVSRGPAAAAAAE
jgi:heme oxygenase